MSTDRLWWRHVKAVARHLNPVALAADLWRQRELLHQLIWREVQTRYRGSFLGLLWAFLQPIAMLTVYTMVFSGVLKSRFGSSPDENPFDFALTMFAGIIVFEVFSELMERSPGLIAANPSYVKKVIFPLYVLPVVQIGSALAHLAIHLLILAAGLLILKLWIPPTFLLLVLVLIPLIMLTAGLAWFFTSLGVYVRDVGQVMAVVTRLLFFVTPIFYPIERVPEHLRWIIRINPLATLVEQARRVLIWNQPIEWQSWGIVTGVSAVVMLLGYAWFMETRRGFADVL